MEKQNTQALIFFTKIIQTESIYRSNKTTKLEKLGCRDPIILYKVEG